jgi:hypothetical protein
MLKHILTLLMTGTLAGSLFASDAQARGGGGSHVGGFGGHIGGFHGMHIRSEVGDPHMGDQFDGIRISGGLRHEIHSGLRHGDEFCSGGDSDCGPYGCRYLWQSQIHCY